MPRPVIISNRKPQTLQCEKLPSKLCSACSGLGGKLQTHRRTCTGRKKPSQALNQGLKSTLDSCFTSQTRKSTIQSEPRCYRQTIWGRKAQKCSDSSPPRSRQGYHIILQNIVAFLGFQSPAGRCRHKD